jgi:hypothetical protein
MKKKKGETQEIHHYQEQVYERIKDFLMHEEHEECFKDEENHVGCEKLNFLYD